MDIRAAAKSLEDRFHDAPWFTMVGMGEEKGRECIFLYVKSLTSVPSRLLKGGWCDFPVIVRRMSAPRAVPGYLSPRRAAKR